MHAANAARATLSSRPRRGLSRRCRHALGGGAADPNALWVTEVWDSEASHAASLSLPSVQEAIRKGRPLIEGFGERWVTAPLGGHGLAD